VTVAVTWGIFYVVQTAERITRFVNVYLHGIVSNLKKISNMSTLPSSGKISDAHASVVPQHSHNAHLCNFKRVDPCYRMAAYEAHAPASRPCFLPILSGITPPAKGAVLHT